MKFTLGVEVLGVATMDCKVTESEIEIGLESTVSVPQVAVSV